MYLLHKEEGHYLFISVKLEDCFKFLWPFQNDQTLIEIVTIKTPEISESFRPIKPDLTVSTFFKVNVLLQYRAVTPPITIIS